VRIPTRAAIPMAMIKQVITALSELALTLSSPCNILSLSFKRNEVNDS
jgi:hypothetical protein